MIRAISWSHDGTILATSESWLNENQSAPAAIHLWRVPQEITTIPLNAVSAPFLEIPITGSSYRLLWSPDNQMLAARVRTSINLYATNTGQTVTTIEAEDPLYSLVWSPDGSQIAGGGDNTIWVWDVSTGQIVQTLSMSDRVNALVWLPDGRIIHNGGDQGLYVNGVSVTIQQTPAANF